jgi:hypothetical protein
MPVKVHGLNATAMLAGLHCSESRSHRTDARAPLQQRSPRSPEHVLVPSPLHALGDTQRPPEHVAPAAAQFTGHCDTPPRPLQSRAMFPTQVPQAVGSDGTPKSQST